MHPSNPPGNSSGSFLNVIFGSSDKSKQTSPLEMEDLPTEKQIPSASVPSPQNELRQLQGFCQNLQISNSRLTQENAKLAKELAAFKGQYSEDIKVAALTLPEEAQKICVAAMDADLLFSTALERPDIKRRYDALLQATLDRILGNYEDGDLRDLRSAQMELKKFRETLQAKLDDWKSKFGIFISLDKELKALETPKTQFTSVPEIIAAMRSEMDNDLVSIFRQVEDNFRKLSEHIEANSKEKDLLAEQAMEKDRNFEILKRELESIKHMAEKFQQASHALTVALKNWDEATKEKEKLSQELTRLRKEHAENTEAKSKLETELIQSQWELKDLKESAAAVETNLKKSQARVKQLEEAEEQKNYLSEALEARERALQNAKSSGKNDAAQKKQAFNLLDEQQREFQDASEIQQAQLKAEIARRSQAEKECETLKAKCDAQQQKLSTLKDVDHIQSLNVFMIGFLQTLPDDLQTKFKEEHDRHFKIE